MSATRFENPIARDGDFADPFVLRFNGRYYLYCTNPDLRCWSSDDLVSWTLEGPTIAPDLFPGLVPFAPEVVYSNGFFYLYTSPSGTGHVVLRSEHPTGPFVSVSGNVAHEIDGNVLIDDDGRWYFYWAGDEGIWACEMPSPTTFGEPVLTGATMHGWTEGPFVTKVDDRYHMTLTGNHYLAPGYRINAAVSDQPLHGFVDDPLNPILLNVHDPGIGLGHSSSVIGPDLVSTYLAYHNLNPDETRDLNIARQVRNGDSIQVLGPTVSAAAPRPPDAVSDWRVEGALGAWMVRSGALAVDGDWARADGPVEAVWQPVLGEPSTSEVTIAGTAGGPYGLLLADTRIEFDPSAGTVSFDGVTAGLPEGFVHTAPHTLRLVIDGGALVLSVDGRRQLTASVPEGEPRLGVFAAAGGLAVGSCATTASTEARADRRSHKPVPGRFWAALGDTDAPAIDAGGYDVLQLRPDAVARYSLDVASAGDYVVTLTGDFAAGDAIAVGDQTVTASAPTRVLAATLRLGPGETPLALRGSSGDPRVALVTVEPVELAPAAFAVTEPVNLEGYGKRILADGVWTDFTLEATVTVRPEAPDGHGDLIFRATQLSEGGSTGADTVLGTDFLLGYSAQVGAGGLVLARHDYDTKVLANAPLEFEPAGPVRVTVRMTGGAIDVSVEGEHLLHVVDPLPHLRGGLGIRVARAALEVERFEAS